jgi:hypothetical protein
MSIKVILHHSSNRKKEGKKKLNKEKNITIQNYEKMDLRGHNHLQVSGIWNLLNVITDNVINRYFVIKLTKSKIILFRVIYVRQHLVNIIFQITVKSMMYAMI